MTQFLTMSNIFQIVSFVALIFAWSIISFLVIRISREFRDYHWEQAKFLNALVDMTARQQGD